MSLYKKIILGLIFCSNVFLGCAKSKAFIGVQLDRYNLVENVMTNKPADLAGIRPRDIILGIEKDKNTGVFTSGSVLEQIQGLPIGKPARIRILRNGQELTFPITATFAPPPPTKYESTLNSWMGHNIDELIRTNWGYPTRSFTAPNGNKVYEYNQSYTYTETPLYFPGQTTINPNYNGGYTVNQSPGIQLGGGTRTNYCATTFEVDRNGILIHWSYKGNSCN